MIGGLFQNHASNSGTLPSNTIPNPKGEMKAITTRSGVTYEGPSIPTNPSPKKVVERETEETTDKGQSNFQGSTAQIPPPVIPIHIPEPDIPKTLPKTTPIPEPDVSKNLPKPNIPYPSRLNQEESRDKALNQMEKIFQIIQDLRFDISFTDALLLMPRFAPTIKSLLMIKKKLLELAKIPLNENCSAMFLKKLPEKLGDPGKLSLPELTPTRMTLELADRSITHPKGVAEDVFVKVGSFHFPADFVIVDFKADPQHVNESIKMVMTNGLRDSFKKIHARTRSSLVPPSEDDNDEKEKAGAGNERISPSRKLNAKSVSTPWDEHLSTFSAEEIIPIPRESEDTSRSDSKNVLPSCDDFSPINVPRDDSVTFSNSLFEFDVNFNSSDINPLFDEVLEDIKCKDSYDSNFDESTFLVTPLSDSNKDECLSPGDDIEFLLHHDLSTPMKSVASILEGFTDDLPFKENDDLFDLECKTNDWKRILYDAPIDKTKYFDPGGDNDEIDAFLAIEVPTYIEEGYYDSEGDILYLESLLSDDNTHNLFSDSPDEYEHLTFDMEPDVPVINNIDNVNEDECFNPGGGEINVEVDDSFTFVTRTFLSYLTYPEVSPLLSSTENEDTIFIPGIST
ncbi:hypothetical protein Tco_1359415 [Tanacetum coccineum]